MRSTIAMKKKIFKAGSFKYDSGGKIFKEQFFTAIKRKNLLYVMTDHKEKR